MKTAPARAILEMWAYGCSASVIAWALRLDGGWRQVNKVVAQARSIKDPRAVLHCDGNPRKGRALLDRRPDLTAISVIRQRQRLRDRCRRGHDYTPENTRQTANGQRRCRECAKLVRRVGWQRERTA